MRKIILVLVLSFFGQFAAAQDVIAPDKGIEGVIQNQIDAFLLDDFEQAFQYAAPSIQQLFGTPDNFGTMVRNGYPMVWRPEDVDFADLRKIQGNLWQKVIVTDQAGQVFALDYKMVRVDGFWRIAAVQLLPMPDLSA
ncbi:DUF4864 domain-containing protein [Tropicibacter sp. R15_0]|uniref:DUF4864 domain-containing protein n=1 Tax=Tropicibacter sp. R15_0 TaxID=2821101 RepID=UPI001AD9A5AD|nr:DUF4864 domain-containing protein [Tropicibacter sp. R15_0]MBO9465748.1 DUF4864 domain-containing protein [Tropicibacter sp. R15_0]